MTIDEFFAWTNDRWQGYRRDDLEQMYIITAGLAGETGEVIEILKKRVRDGKFDRDDLILELGDVVHYWCRILNRFDITPDQVFAANVAKLEARDREKLEIRN